MDRRAAFAASKQTDMSAPSSRLTAADTTLYQEFIAERDEILRHKWYESEKAGRDVGFEYALTDWNLKHRADWRRTRRGGKGVGFGRG